MEIPSGWSGLINFLVFIAPGLSFEAVWSARRPSAKRTAFEEVTRTVAASVASWAFIGFLSALLLLRWGGWLDPVIDFVADPVAALSPERGSQALLSVLLPAAAVGVAVSGSGLAAWVLTKQGATTNRAGSTLWTVLRLRVPKGGRPFVWVDTKDGRTVGGFYAAGDLRPGEDGTGDLALERPLFDRTPGSEPEPLDPVQFVVVPGQEISLLTVTVLPEDYFD